MATTFQVTFDCADPDRLARFWAAALGYKLQDPPAGFASWPAFLADQGVPEEQWNSASAVVDPDGKGPRIFFQQVPEPKTVKNRVHLDVNVGGGHGTALDERRRRVDAEVERLVGLGASRQQPMEQRGEYWVVLRDPEGNEFCLQ
jgi:catechol 2,3-dioxygenase-like lactoylglutathione lyase family enzyme